MRNKDKSTAIAALLRAFWTQYPCVKTREDDVPELCGVALAKEIRENFKWREEGWGRMKVTVKIGSSEWKTSIWFDTKHDTYLLPIKAEIRKKEKIEMEVGKEVKATIWV